MPSADPVHSDDAPPPAGPPGRVLPFTRNRTTGPSGGVERPARSERAPQPRQPGQVDASPQHRLAVDVEACFLAERQTLTDERTAAAYRTTLDQVQLYLDGSLATDHIDNTAHQHLSGLLRALRDLPDEL
ncbi:hypothetical protein ACWCPT_29720 [Streptomyces sp. NPDC002308]